METSRIRLKLGIYEFEAEGTEEFVGKHLDRFSALMESFDAGETVNSTDENDEVIRPSDRSTATQSSDQEVTKLGKIIASKNDVLSLTALPQGDQRESDAVLLLMLGYKVLLNQEQVLGIPLLAGLKQSGISLERVDKVIGSLPTGLVIHTGIKKGKRYRLTNSGVTRAWQLADGLLKTIA